MLRPTKSHQSTNTSSRSDYQSGSWSIFFILANRFICCVLEIKLPIRGDTHSPSLSPPPGYEEYIVQKVVNVRNGKVHENGKGESLAPHENETCFDSNDGNQEAGKVDLSLQLEGEFSTCV